MNARKYGFLLAAAALLAMACHGAASATTTTLNADVTPTKANGNFIAGTGIPANGFAIDTNTPGQAVALKARQRDTGQALSINGNRYRVPTGLAPASSNPAWNFDWQFNPGPAGTIADDLSLELKVDFDPAAGLTDFVVLDAPMFGATGWETSDGFFLNPGAGGWSDDSIDYVYSQSWHLGFGFWGKAYDPDVQGEYEIMLTAKDAGGAMLATSNIFVEVVPEPASAVMLGIGCVGLLMRRRRSH